MPDNNEQPVKFAGHMKTENLVVCQCQHCNENIEFDASGQWHENSRIQCPHCSIETVLFIPLPSSESATKSQVKPIEIDGGWRNSTAPKKQKKVENKLEGMANLLFMLGIAGMIFGVIGAIAMAAASSDRWFWPILIGVAGMVSCGVISVFLKSQAEMIRLLKRMTGHSG